MMYRGINRYALAIVYSLIALIVSWALWPIAGSSILLVLLVSVVISTEQAGAGPGLLCGILGIALVHYFVFEASPARPTNADTLAYVAVFVVAAIAVIGWKVWRNPSGKHASARDGRLELILNSIHDGIIAHDDRGRFIYVNSAAAGLLGYSSPEALILTDTFQLPPEIELSDIAGKSISPSTLRDLLSSRNAQSTPAIFRKRIKTSGETTWFQITTSRTKDVSQNVEVGITILQDITKQVEAEHERSYYAAIVQNSGDAIVGLTVEGIVTSWNPGAERIFGYEAAEAIGQPISMIFPKDIASRESLLLARVQDGEKIENYETRRVCKDGHEIEISLTISPIWTSTGYLRGFSAIERDIGKSKQRELEIIRLTSLIEGQRRRLDAIVRNVPGIIYDMTVDFESGEQRMNYISDQSSKMLGYDPDQWYANPDLWQKVVDSDDWQKSLHEAKDAFHNNRPGKVQLKCQTASGETIYAESFFNFAATETDVRQFGLIMNITQRKLIEAELAEFMQELRQSNEELEQFAYVASHDLQEPLRMITSYLQLIEQRYRNQLDDDIREFIHFAVDGAARMKTLINDLLTYSHIQRSAIDSTTVNMQQIFDHVLDNLQFNIEDAQAVITHDTLPTAIFANEAQMVQLVQNLISNALKYRGNETPLIHVGAERSGSYWHFSVRDNGIGIAPEHHERVFVLFQRLHTRQEYPGTGIGLAICRKIIEQHGGRIWIESQYGEGTTVHFTVPLSYRKRINLHESR